MGTASQIGSFSVHTAMIRGAEAFPVTVEVSGTNGIPGYHIIGMADSTVMEAPARVRCAIGSCGFDNPRLAVTINLAPSGERKTGTGFDLPIAVAVLAASGQIPTVGLDSCLFVGELSLQGEVCPVRGAYAYALLAERMGLDLVAAREGLPFGGVACGCRVIEGLGRLRGGVGALPAPHELPDTDEPVDAADEGTLDYVDVCDQEVAKRALVIAATGKHGVLMVGPPGAGKTMLIRMILRHLRAQEGSIKICGEDIEKRGPHSKGRVSAVLENPSYYRYMTGLDHLKMATRPYKDINVEMIREVVDRTGLKTCIRDKVATYTSKQRYMLAVAQALVTQPALLLLDEPTDDLDPVGIKNLREILKEEATKGVCVVVSSHILSEMDMLCTRIIIMKDGRFISDLSSHELLDPNRARVRIRVGQPERAYEVLEALFDDTTVRIDNDELIVTGENLQIPQMNRTLIFNEVDVYEIAVNREPLEEYFMELMREEE